MLIGLEEYQKLYTYVVQQLQTSHVCCLKHTIDWFQANFPEYRQTLECLATFGVYCDCTLIEMMRPAIWEEWRGRGIIAPINIDDQAWDAYIDSLILEA